MSDRMPDALPSRLPPVAAGALLAAAALLPLPHAALTQQDGAAPDSAAAGADIAIYPGGPALVSEDVPVTLPAGRGIVLWNDPPSGLDFTSLSASFPDQPGARILEQRQLAGGAGMGELLDASTGGEVGLVLTGGDTLRATLLSTSGGLLLRDSDGSVVSVLPEQVRALLLPALPEGLRLAPAIAWRVRSARAGRTRAGLRYLTGGLDWHAEYALTLAPSDSSLEVETWADLRDEAGRSWPGARIRLVAGELNRASAPQAFGGVARAKAMAEAAPASDQARERSFSEYHVFELPAPVTLEDGQTVRSLLLRASGVPARKLYLYAGGEGFAYGATRPIVQPEPGQGSSKANVETYLELWSGEHTPLDRPLPAGRARIYEEDADGSTLLSGEASVPDLMVGDTARLPLGLAFDLTAERTRVDFRRPDAHDLVESYRVVLRSAKKSAVRVRVTERMFRWHEWRIDSETVDGRPARHARPDADHARWVVTVPAGGETTLEYTVRYSWSEEDLRQSSAGAAPTWRDPEPPTPGDLEPPTPGDP